MTYEELIAAKVRMIEVQNIATLWVAAGLAVIACAGLALSFKKDWSMDETPFLLRVLSGVFLLMGLLIGGASWFHIATAETKARADLANYGLMELKK
jgi:cbb3-type cytochrome oxidase subunit 3